MKIFFPKTNPIAFRQQGAYYSDFDCRENEYVNEYIQPYIVTDFLSFQLQIERRFGLTFDIEVLVEYQDGTSQVLDTQLNITSHIDIAGVYPAKFVKNVTATKSVYCMSDTFANLAIGAGRGWFRLVIRVKPHSSIAWNIFVSNKLCLLSDTRGTKLLHYTHNVSYISSVFDTFFSLMPSGYDIRLYCSFMQEEQKSSNEVYQAYDGRFELVSSLPYSVVKLQLDNNTNGFPDYVIEHLNHIFKCEYKYIDGIRYQVTDNAELSIEQVAGYNNRFCSIELQEVEREYYIADFEDFGDIIVNNEQKDITIVGDVGEVAIVSNSADVSFSTNVIDSDTKTIGFSTKKNLTGTDETISVQLINIADNNIIAMFEVVNIAIDRGICFSSICDNFIVK